MKLKTMDKIKWSGYLYRAENDSVVILKEKLKNVSMRSLMNPPTPWITSLAPVNIEKIVIQKGRKAPMYGAGIGLASGVLIGFSMGSDPEGAWFRFTAGDKAVLLGATGMVTGALVGTIIYFASKKVFKINGNASHYRSSKDKLSKYDMFQRVY